MEEKKDEEESTLNEGEADVAIAHANRLVQSGVQACDIGIITPYAAQVPNCPVLSTPLLFLFFFFSRLAVSRRLLMSFISLNK